MADEKRGMKEYLKKSVFVGLGLATMTRERIRAFAKEVAEHTKMSEEEGEKFAKELTEESQKAQQRLESRINKMVEDAKDKLPGMKRIRDIEQRLDALEKRLDAECCKDSSAAGAKSTSETKSASGQGTKKSDSGKKDSGQSASASDK